MRGSHFGVPLYLLCEVDKTIEGLLDKHLMYACRALILTSTNIDDQSYSSMKGLKETAERNL